MTGGDGFIVVLPRRATARSLASYGACAAVARPVNAEGLPIGTNTSDVTRLSAIRCRPYAYAANTPPAGGGSTWTAHCKRKGVGTSARRSRHPVAIPARNRGGPTAPQGWRLSPSWVPVLLSGPCSEG